MTNSEDCSLTRVCTVLSVPSVFKRRVFTVYDTLNILHNILREKLFDMGSEGSENISVFLKFVAIGCD